MDIIGSLLGLLIILPFVPFIVLAIKVDSRGGVIVGLDRISAGRVIKVYKFRSMVYDALEKKQSIMHLNERSDGPFFKIKNDPRITRTGKFLRKFRIDEFPQLVNVLKGELALVGPRPHEPEEIEKYPDEFKKLRFARVGATGYSQINGASNLKFLKELELDMFYINHVSFWFDLKIIAKTIAVLFFDPTAV